MKKKHSNSRQPGTTARLKPYVVLFADILGFKKLLRTTTNQDALYKRLRAALSAALAVFDYAKKELELKTVVRVFTDCVVVANPISRIDDEEALGDVVLQAARFQWEMLKRGFFIRGGLEVGMFHADNRYMFGLGLLAAYDLESKKAKFPRIVLGPAATFLATTHQRYWGNPKEAPAFSTYLWDKGATCFIDYLSASAEQVFAPDDVYFMAEPTHKWLLDRMPMHKKRVETALEKNQDNENVRAKFAWLARFHNFIVHRWFPREKHLLLGHHGGKDLFGLFMNKYNEPIA